MSIQWSMRSAVVVSAVLTFAPGFAPAGAAEPASEPTVTVAPSEVAAGESVALTGTCPAGTTVSVDAFLNPDNAGGVGTIAGRFDVTPAADGTWSSSFTVPS